MEQKKKGMTEAEWKIVLQSAKDYLEKTGNRNVKYMYGWMNTCANFTDAVVCYDKVESMLKKQEINYDDYVALNTVLCDMVTTGKFKDSKVTLDKDENMLKCFHKRVWSEADIGKVMQFRNCVTDMYMLGFLELDEYIDLNNEVDRYIQYAITNGK